MNAPIQAPTLAQLCAWRMQAKQAEDTAIASRRDIDKQIALVMKDRDEGTHTETIEGLKVSVTYKIDRKVDTEKLTGLWPTMTAEAQAAFKWSADVSIAKLRAIQELRPEEYATLAAAITSKDASPTVKVEEVK